MMSPSANSLRFLLCFLSVLLVVVMADETQRSVQPQETKGGPKVTGLDAEGQTTDKAEKTINEEMAASPKVEWPETVGLTVDEAETIIKKDMPDVHIQVIPPGTSVTMDFQKGRVRIFTDISGKVSKPPRVG